MSPHGRLRERGIFLADLDHERGQRAPGEAPTLRRPAIAPTVAEVFQGVDVMDTLEVREAVGRLLVEFSPGARHPTSRGHSYPRGRSDG